MRQRNTRPMALATVRARPPRCAVMSNRGFAGAVLNRARIGAIWCTSLSESTGVACRPVTALLFIATKTEGSLTLRSPAIPILSCAALAFLWSGSLAAAGRYPSIQLISPATPAVETSQFSMTLQGSAVTENGLANVHWVNQFGKSGRGTWVENLQREASWTVPEIALRPGVNLVTVTVVDAANRSSSLHLAINRKAGAANELPRSLQLGTGVYQNRPIEYQLWNGHAVVEGDIIVDLSTFSRPDGANSAAVKGAAVTPDGLAINYTSQLWRKVAGVYHVPYVQTGSSASATTAIAQFNGTFTGLIQFVPHTAQANYVNIITDAGGSGEGHSKVGGARGAARMRQRMHRGHLAAGDGPYGGPAARASAPRPRQIHQADHRKCGPAERAGQFHALFVRLPNPRAL